MDSRGTLDLNPRLSHTVDIELLGSSEGSENVLFESKLFIVCLGVEFTIEVAEEEEKSVSLSLVESKMKSRSRRLNSHYTVRFGVHSFANRSEELLRIENVETSVDSLGNEFFGLLDVVTSLKSLKGSAIRSF